MRKPRQKARELIVPFVLTVTTVTTALAAVTTAASVVASAGCGDEEPAPPVDAGPPDTPIV